MRFAKLALRKNSATGSLRAAGQILLYPASKFLLTDGPTSWPDKYTARLIDFFDESFEVPMPVGRTGTAGEAAPISHPFPYGVKTWMQISSPAYEIEVPYLPVHPIARFEGSQKPITPIIPYVFQCTLSAPVVASGTSVTTPGIDGKPAERQT